MNEQRRVMRALPAIAFRATATPCRNTWAGSGPMRSAPSPIQVARLARLLRGDWASGVTITDVFELLGADADSGVLMGEVDMEFDGSLRPGATYEGDGEIAAVERKHRARAGFDRVQPASRSMRRARRSPSCAVRPPGSSRAEGWRCGSRPGRRSRRTSSSR